MTDRIAQRYNGNDDLKYASNDANGRSSMHHCQSLWMAHWMQRSCNSASMIPKHFGVHDKSKEGDCHTKYVYAPVQVADSRKDIRLDVDVGPSSISEYKKNTWGYKRGGLEITSDIPQTPKEVATKTGKIQLADVTITNQSKNVNSVDPKATQSGTLSVCKLSGSSGDRRNATQSPFPCLRNTRSERQPFFPTGDSNQEIESMLALEMDPAECKGLSSRTQINDKSGYGATTVCPTEPHIPWKVSKLSRPNREFASKEYHFQAEGASQNPFQQIKPFKSLEKKSVPISRPFQKNFTGSTSNSVIYPFEYRGPNTVSTACNKGEKNKYICGLSGKEHFATTNFAHVEHECCNHPSYSTFLFSDKKTPTDTQVVTKNAGSSCLGQKGEAVQLRDGPSTSDFHFPIPFGEQSKKSCEFSVTGSLTNHIATPELTKLEKLKEGHHTLHRMPTCSVHDMEAWRICTTTVDSVGGLPGGHTKISQTTHHLSITKKTDLNFSKGDEMIRGSAVSTKFKGNSFQDMFTLPPVFHSYGKQKVKLQLLESSTDSGGKENVRDLKIQNESSAETGTMYIDLHQSRNSPTGATSSPPCENVMVGQNTSKPKATLASLSKEGRRENPETELPDLNEEIPTCLPVADSVDNRELSTSRTESLDVENLLSNVEQPENSNSSPQLVCGLESGSRWVKRLKSNASDSLGLGTRSSKMGDATSTEKVNKLLSRIMNYSTASSSPSPTLGKHLGKGQQQVDKHKNNMLFKNREFSSVDLVKKSQDLTISHSWIKRWCRSREGSPQVRTTSWVACEPENSRAALEELQRKQFPSIAAMALMGKTVRNFQPCEFRKRGSTVVWNA